MPAYNIARAAYRGGPPPKGPLERAQYYMLRRLYELHGRGTLPKADAAHLKGLVLDWEKLPSPARRELLDAFIGSWGGEDLRRFTPEIKELSKLYVKELE